RRARRTTCGCAAARAGRGGPASTWSGTRRRRSARPRTGRTTAPRSEEHTSELQSRSDLVCRLLLEKKKKESQSYYYRYHASTTSIQSITLSPHHRPPFCTVSSLPRASAHLLHCIPLLA